MAHGRYTDDFDGLDDSEAALLAAYGDGMDRAHIESTGAASDTDDDFAPDDEYVPECIFNE